MDENTIHQWLIDCFGPIQGELAWSQLSQLPDEVRDQLMSQDPSRLPKPADVQSLMQAFTAGGLNTVDDMTRVADAGPINVKLAKSMALRRAAEGDDAVTAEQAEAVSRAASEANLWLDAACAFDPVDGDMAALTRSGWVEGTLDAWAGFAAPVAKSMSDALASVIAERFGGSFGGEVTGLFAGPVPIPLPEGIRDPATLMRLVGNTSFAMQLGQAAGGLSREVRGSFDQGLPLLAGNPAGGLIVANVLAYAKSLELDQGEALAFLAAQEAAHARLFHAVPWLMPRFEALIGKYARGVDIDLDAMEEQLRDAQSMDPESISGAMNLTNVGISDTPEQREALKALETLLALVEGWVDSVVWRACMAHVPHLEQLREMARRERAVGGPAERTFESLLGLHLRPRRMREAAEVWEALGSGKSVGDRDSLWSHPDLLPRLPDEKPTDSDATGEVPAVGGPSPFSDATPTDQTGPNAADTTATAENAAPDADGIDWDAELQRLLDEEDGDDDGGGSDAADGGSGDKRDRNDAGNAADGDGTTDDDDDGNGNGNDDGGNPAEGRGPIGGTPAS